MTLMANGGRDGDVVLSTIGLVPAQPMPAGSFVAPKTAWRSVFVHAAMAVDAGMLLLAGLLAQLAPSSGPIGNPGYAAVVAIAWWLFLSFCRAHEARFLGDGPEEFRRVANASLRLGFTVTFLAYTFALPIHRVFLAVLVVLGSAFLLVGRYGLRCYLSHGRRHGRYFQKVVLAGSYQHVRELASQLRVD